MESVNIQKEEIIQIKDIPYSVLTSETTLSEQPVIRITKLIKIYEKSGRLKNLR